MAAVVIDFRTRLVLRPAKLYRELARISTVPAAPWNGLDEEQAAILREMDAIVGDRGSDDPPDDDGGGGSRVIRIRRVRKAA
jgi:hypothetical protein